MKFEQSIDIAVEPKVVFSAYKQVQQWHEWDPETESASLDGDFALGVTGKVKPKGAPESKMTVIEITQDHSFTIECKLPLCKMHFIHLMTPIEGGTRLVNQVEFIGLLSPLFGILIGKGINKTLSGSLEGLKSYLEK